MTSASGVTPPLHRRFDKSAALRYIRNRYKRYREEIRQQVVKLQQDTAFLNKCKDYYDQGYKDWVILGAIYNCMFNWQARERGLELRGVEDLGKFSQLQYELHNVVYPADRFLEEDMDSHIRMFNIMALRTYGFDLRHGFYDPASVEEFLRSRMRHFEFDFKHKPLFGEPPGDWPKV